MRLINKEMRNIYTFEMTTQEKLALAGFISLALKENHLKLDEEATRIMQQILYGLSNN